MKVKMLLSIILVSIISCKNNPKNYNENYLRINVDTKGPFQNFLPPFHNKFRKIEMYEVIVSHAGVVFI